MRFLPNRLAAAALLILLARTAGAWIVAADFHRRAIRIEEHARAIGCSAAYAAQTARKLHGRPTVVRPDGQGVADVHP